MLILFRRKYKVNNVFTPSTAATLTYIKRTELENQFISALDIPGMQLIIYGNTGSGKTTLYNYLLKRKGRKYIITRCDIHSTVKSLIREAFDKLDVSYVESTSLNQSSNLQTLFASLKMKISCTSLYKQKRLLPIQMTAQRLIDYLGPKIWIIEDFHKVDDSEKVNLAQVFKHFVDSSIEHSTKIIAVGAARTAREVVKFNSELSNRICQLYVPLFTENDLEKIIVNGTRILNCEVENDTISDIIYYSNNLASTCHSLCHCMCASREIRKTSNKKVKLDKIDLKRGIKLYKRQNSDSYVEIWEKINKLATIGSFNPAISILTYLSKIDEEAVDSSKILGAIRQSPKCPSYEFEINSYLEKLTSTTFNEILRYDDINKLYSISNNVYKSFLRVILMSQSDHIDLEESMINSIKKLREL